MKLWTGIINKITYYEGFATKYGMPGSCGIHERAVTKKCRVNSNEPCVCQFADGYYAGQIIDCSKVENSKEEANMKYNSCNEGLKEYYKSPEYKKSKEKLRRTIFL